ncbi:hypothetical protein Mapa_006973 [Marchantia paleacea]|nr:hypothetical protein Mapa_006973 [Marchantia paleacea]
MCAQLYSSEAPSGSVLTTGCKYRDISKGEVSEPLGFRLYTSPTTSEIALYTA